MTPQRKPETSRKRSKPGNVVPFPDAPKQRRPSMLPERGKLLDEDVVWEIPVAGAKPSSES